MIHLVAIGFPLERNSYSTNSHFIFFFHHLELFSFTLKIRQIYIVQYIAVLSYSNNSFGLLTFSTKLNKRLHIWKCSEQPSMALADCAGILISARIKVIETISQLTPHSSPHVIALSTKFGLCSRNSSVCYIFIILNPSRQTKQTFQ